MMRSFGGPPPTTPKKAEEKKIENNKRVDVNMPVTLRRQYSVGGILGMCAPTDPYVCIR